MIEADHVRLLPWKTKRISSMSVYRVKKIHALTSPLYVLHMEKGAFTPGWYMSNMPFLTGWKGVREFPDRKQVVDHVRKFQQAADATYRLTGRAQDPTTLRGP